MHGDLAAEPESGGQPQVVPAPEAARVVPAWTAGAGQQSHGLIGQRQHLRAVSRLQPGIAAPDGAEDILKIRAVVVNDDLDDYMSYYKARYLQERHLARYDPASIPDLGLTA